MGFYKEKTRDYFLLDTSVENMFINEYMKSAPGEYVKVYLFALMYAGLEEELSNEDVAKHLNMEQEDVLKAWTYWEKQGVIRKHNRGSGSGFDYDVEFVMLKEQLYGESSQPRAAAQNIGSMMTDPEVKKMVEDIEQLTGRVFNSSDVQKILSWIDDYQILPETITFAFEYAKKKKKPEIRYIGALVRDWGGRGLRDVASVQEDLGNADRKNAQYRRVFQALGFSRNATEEERRIMDSWFEEMDLSLETVLDACSRTAGIASPNINYVNKVLHNWKQEGRTKKNSDPEAPSAREIMQYYDMLRQQEEAAARARRDEVYRKVPRIREIDESCDALSRELSRIIISDTVDRKKAAASIRQEMEALNTEKAFLLTENEFELDYMEIRYECPECRDTGILDTGEKCQCYAKVTRERINQILAAQNRQN